MSMENRGRVQELESKLGVKARAGDLVLKNGKSSLLIKKKLFGVKTSLYFNDDSAYVEFRGFFARCAFRWSAAPTRLSLSLTCEASASVQSPYPVFISAAKVDQACIAEAFRNSWDFWRPMVGAVKSGALDFVLSDQECVLEFHKFDPEEIARQVKVAAHLLCLPPFQFRTALYSSRYSDKAGISIQIKNIPPDLRPLLPLAIKWAFADDDDVLKFAKAVGPEQVRAFVQAINERITDIERYWSYEGPTPVPDEVVLFQLMGNAYALLRG